MAFGNLGNSLQMLTGANQPIPTGATRAPGLQGGGGIMASGGDYGMVGGNATGGSYRPANKYVDPAYAPGYAYRNYQTQVANQNNSRDLNSFAQMMNAYNQARNTTSNYSGTLAELLGQKPAATRPTGNGFSYDPTAGSNYNTQFRNWALSRGTGPVNPMESILRQEQADKTLADQRHQETLTRGVGNLGAVLRDTGNAVGNTFRDLFNSNSNTGVAYNMQKQAALNNGYIEVARWNDKHPDDPISYDTYKKTDGEWKRNNNYTYNTGA